jgi:carboxyl-terminal processing protease
MSIQSNNSNSLTLGDREKILKNIRKLVLSRHINVSQPNQNYSKWLAIFDERLPELLSISDTALFEKGVREVLQALGSSHTAFFQKTAAKVPAPYSINASLRAVDTPSGKRWMFEDVVEDGVAAVAGIKSGDLLVSIDSTAVMPPLIPSFFIGGSHLVEIGSYIGGTRQITMQVPDRRAKNRPPMIEPRSLSYSFTSPDVGYLKVNSFPGNIGLDFAKGLDHAIEQLNGQGAKRLVIDLRGNVGGALGSLRLMSYLCAGKMEIGHSLTRLRLRNGYDKHKLTRIGKIPSTKLDLLLMFVRFKFIQRDRSMILVTEGLGSQPFHGRIVMLIDEHCHSATEMVASFAKDNGLAKLVGTRSAGEVLGGANFVLQKGYRLRMPVAGWYTWKGHCIEGIGVEPDVSIENSPESLSSGVDRQLEKALEVVKTL